MSDRETLAYELTMLRSDYKDVSEALRGTIYDLCRAQGVIKALVAGWESLPAGTGYPSDLIQAWLDKHLYPVVQAARKHSETWHEVDFESDRLRESLANVQEAFGGALHQWKVVSDMNAILREALENATKALELLSKDNRNEGFESVVNIRDYAAKHARIARDALLRAGKGEGTPSTDRVLSDKERDYVSHLKPAPKPELRSCEWHYNPDEDDYWMTSCGAEWCMDMGTPAESGYVHCPKCGKPIDYQEPAASGEEE